MPGLWDQMRGRSKSTYGKFSDWSKNFDDTEMKNALSERGYDEGTDDYAQEYTKTFFDQAKSAGQYIRPSFGRMVQNQVPALQTYQQMLNINKGGEPADWRSFLTDWMGGGPNTPKDGSATWGRFSPEQAKQLLGGVMGQRDRVWGGGSTGNAATDNMLKNMDIDQLMEYYMATQRYQYSPFSVQQRANNVSDLFGQADRSGAGAGDQWMEWMKMMGLYQ